MLLFPPNIFIASLVNLEVQSLRRTDLAKSLFVSFCFSRSFIPLVSEFSLNFVGQILQCKSLCAVCPFTCIALGFHIFTATQFNIITSVGIFHFFASLQESPLSLGSHPHFLLCWHPPVHFLFSMCLFWTLDMMRIVFWLFFH